MKFCGQSLDSPRPAPTCLPAPHPAPPSLPFPPHQAFPPCRAVASTLPPYREAPSSLPPYTVPYSCLPPGSLFDSHCHLDFLSRRLRLGPSLDLRQVVTSDPHLDWASFGGCVAVYCHPKDWRGGPSLSLQRAAGEDRAHLALGCHPHYSNLWHLGSTKYELEAAIRRLGPRLVALGECGLDYTRKNLVAREQQMSVQGAGAAGPEAGPAPGAAHQGGRGGWVESPGGRRAAQRLAYTQALLHRWPHKYEILLGQARNFSLTNQ